MTDDYMDFSHLAEHPAEESSAAPVASNDSYMDFSHLADGSEAPPSHGATKDVGGAGWRILADVPMAAGSSALGTVAKYATEAQFAAEKAGYPGAANVARDLSVLGHRAGEWVDSGISEGGKRALEAQAIPDPGHAYLTEHPLDSAAMKMASGAGFMGEMAVGGLGGLPGLAAMGAASQTANSIDAAIGWTNEFTDAELAQKAPRFAELLKETGDPNKARAALHDEMYSWVQAGADAAIGAASFGIFGKAFTAGKAALGGIEKVGEQGVTQAVRQALTTGALETISVAGAMATGAGSTDVAAQKGQNPKGAIDWEQTIKAGANAAAEGAILDRAPHIVGGAKRWFEAPKWETEASPDDAQNAALKQKTETAAANTKAAVDAQQGTSAPAAPVSPIVTPPPPAPPSEAQRIQTAADNTAAAVAQQQSAPVVDHPVTESPDTLAAQADAVAEGRRPAVMYPAGTTPPAAIPEGMQRIEVKGHVFDIFPEDFGGIDPERLLSALIEHDKIGEFLGYGPMSKTDVINSGEKPMVTTETTPDGKEVVSALTTETRAPETETAVTNGAAPGNIVETKPAEAVNDIVAARGEAPTAPSAPTVSRQGVAGYDTDPADRLRGRIAYVEQVRDDPNTPQHVRDEYVSRAEELKSLWQVREKSLAGLPDGERAAILGAQPGDIVSGTSRKGIAVEGATFKSFDDKGVNVHDRWGMDHQIPYENITGLHSGDVKVDVQGRQNAGASAPNAPESLENIGGAGKAIRDNMFGALWEKLQKGDLFEGDKPSAVLQAADMVRARGGMKTIEDFVALANDYAKIERGPNFQNDMRALVDRHTPDVSKKAEKIDTSEPPVDPGDMTEARDFADLAPPAGETEKPTAPTATEGDWKPSGNTYGTRSAAQAIVDNKKAGDRYEVTQRPDGKFGITERVQTSDAGSHEVTPPKTEGAIRVNSETKQVSSKGWKFDLSSKDAIAITSPDGGSVNVYDRDQRQHYNRRDEAYLDEVAKYLPESVLDAVRAHLKEGVTPEEFAERLRGKREAPKTEGKGKEKVDEVKAKKTETPKTEGKGKEKAAEVKAKKTRRRERDREEQEAGKRGPHDAAARSESNKIAAEVVEANRVPDDVLAAAADGRSTEGKAAREKIVAHLVKALSDFVARAKAYNDSIASKPLHGRTTKTIGEGHAEHKADPKKSNQNYKPHAHIPNALGENVDAAMSPSAGLQLLYDARKLVNASKKDWMNFIARYSELTKGDLTRMNMRVQEERRSEGDSYNSAKLEDLARATFEGIVDETADTSRGVIDKEIESIQERLDKGEITKEQAAELIAAEKLAEPTAPAPKKEKTEEQLAAEKALEERLAARRAEREAEENAKTEVRRVAPTELTAEMKAALERDAERNKAAKAEFEARKAAEAKKTEEAKKAKKSGDIASEWMEKNRKALKDVKVEDETETDDAWMHELSKDEPVSIEDRKGNKHHPLRTETLRDVLHPSDYRNGKLSGLFTPLIVRRILEIAGDTPVHTFENSSIDAIVGPFTRGAYNHKLNTIVMRDNYRFGEKQRKQVLLHEAAHAAMFSIIERNPVLKHRLLILRDFVQFHEIGVGADGEGRFVRNNDYDRKTTVDWNDQYAFTNGPDKNPNPQEFVAEAIGNEAFKKRLSMITLDARHMDMLGFGESHTRKGYFLTAWDAFANLYRKAFNLPPKSITALEALLSLSDRGIETELQYRREDALLNDIENSHLKDEWLPDRELGRAGRALDFAREHLSNAGESLRRLNNKVSFLNNLEDRLDRSLGSNPGEGLASQVGTLRRAMRVAKETVAEKFGGWNAVYGLGKLEREVGREVWDKVKEVVYEARRRNISLFGDNAHLGKDAMSGWSSKPHVDRLKNELAAALTPEQLGRLKGHLDTLGKYQNERSIATIRAILEHVDGVSDPAGLARRFFEGKLTPVEERFLDPEDKGMGEASGISEVLNALKDAKDLSKVEGTYAPLMREGSHVVTAKLKVDLSEADGGELMSDGRTVQFTQREGESAAALRRRAKAFAEKSGHEFDQPHEVFVDKGKPLGERIPTDSEEGLKAYRLPVRVDHVEMMDGEYAGNKIYDALRSDGRYDTDSVTRPAPKHRDFTMRGQGMLSPQMDALMNRLRKQSKFKALAPEQQSAIIGALNESTLRMRAGVGLGKNSLNARNVLGHSHDLTRAAADYIDRASSDIARSEHMPLIDKKLAELDTAIKAGADKKGAGERGELQQEIKNRIYNLTDDNSPGHGAQNPWVRRFLQYSSLDKLAGVSYNAIQSLEPIMIGAPVIGGRHGHAAATGAMLNAYNMIGAGSAMKIGLRDTMRAAKGGTNFTNYVDFFKSQLPKDKMGANIGAMLDYLHKNGAIDREGEYFFRDQVDPKASVIGRGLNTLDRMARQVTTAVESIGRAVTAIAAYQLELRKTKDHDKAVTYAYRTVLDTAGDYSRANSSPIFNSNAAAMALQFKKYGLRTYQLLGKMMGGMLRGDKEARWSLFGVLAAQQIVSGSLGLPTGAFKAAAFIGSGGTITDDDWNIWLRGVESWMGKSMGEVAARGVPHAFGVDLSGRTGMSSLLARDTPEAMNEEAIDKWIGKNFLGAFGSSLVDTASGIAALFRGDLVGATKALPVRAVHDVATAYERHMRGKETGKGYQSQTPYSTSETILRGLGFTPARESEINDAKSMTHAKDAGQKHDVDSFKQQWLKASPDQRARLWGQIEQWNRGLPPAARLSRADLDGYVRHHKEVQTVFGQQVRKNTKHIFDKANSIYNTGAR